MELIHYFLHAVGFCPEVIGTGLAMTPQFILQSIHFYIKLKLTYYYDI